MAPATTKNSSDNNSGCNGNGGRNSNSKTHSRVAPAPLAAPRKQGKILAHSDHPPPGPPRGAPGSPKTLKTLRFRPPVREVKT